MSGETANQESGWTTDTLRQDVISKLDDLEKLFNQRFIDNDKAIQAALLAAKEAVAAALAAAKEAGTELKQSQSQQLDAHNGLIRKMEIQTNTFIPRQEADIKFKAWDEKLDAAVRPLNDYITGQRGQAKQSDLTMGRIVALIGILSGIILFANWIFK